MTVIACPFALDDDLLVIKCSEHVAICSAPILGNAYSQQVVYVHNANWFCRISHINRGDL